MSFSSSHKNHAKIKAVLVLHGSRQTGQLLLGRMDKLRKKLKKQLHLELVAPDAPWVCKDDEKMRTWWQRNDNTDPNDYVGLDQSLERLNQLWNFDRYEFQGIVGFSQGARLAHLISEIATCDNQQAAGRLPHQFPNLNFVIMVSNYEAPLPTHWKYAPRKRDTLISISSLHVWGDTDKLILPSQSQAVTKHYENPIVYTHEGGHHVPMRAAAVEAYLAFMESTLGNPDSVSEAAQGLQTRTSPEKPDAPQVTPTIPSETEPDEETALAQQDEVEALSVIFPEELTLLSGVSVSPEGDKVYQHPIAYQLALPPSNEGTWPLHPVVLKVKYSSNYPTDVGPIITLQHDNNVFEFGSSQVKACEQAISAAAQLEQGMPCVMSCVYAARDFFESGGMQQSYCVEEEENKPDIEDEEDKSEKDDAEVNNSALIQSVSPERIEECNLEGLEIARSILQKTTSSETSSNGGSWKYTIGLVGKPSAGKSTFFNAATAFARQRDDADNALGGATMAPHPFTTIDPNVGYCLAPAPPGSCPEEENEKGTIYNIGCTHGRDAQGRRLIPVMLKDVAGLVPGAYQGRGRGNKFLNDLCDADALIHVVDVSGTADTEGNTVGDSEGSSNPLDDLAWIHKELIEWVYVNLMYKWDSIQRRGRNKLAGMFGGYGQNQATTFDILLGVEQYMASQLQRDHALDHLEEWDQGDVHRLVSAFLGVRFPMVLALNKSDLPSAAEYIRAVQDALPVHGAHIGVPLSSRCEMQFVRHHVEAEAKGGKVSAEESQTTPPIGVWQCLLSSFSIRGPCLVFPVSDMVTYAPLPGMQRIATQDSSLPNDRMVSCLLAAGGAEPSLWDPQQKDYSKRITDNVPLRDVLVMKPRSTVEDVFLVLKRIGALGGEFVRAEGCASLGDKPKLVPKLDVVDRNCRILKIMTNKRREWQMK